MFVVKLSSLKHKKDIYCDDMGSWKSNGHYTSIVDVDAGGDISCVSSTEVNLTTNMYIIKKKYFKHGTSKDLKKTVVILEGDYSTTCYSIIIA